MPPREPTPHPPERRPTVDVLLRLLLALAVTAGVTLWLVLQVPAIDRLVVGVTAGALSVVLSVAVAAATHRASGARRTANRLRVLENELAQLAGETLPDATARVREGATVDAVLAELGPRHGDIARDVLRAAVREVGVSERQRAAAMAACASAAGRVQAMATSMLADLRDMEGRHPESVLGDLLKLDHSTAQTGRLADSIAVLTGARSGRRWTRPIVMESILRGAMGRIQAYQRVQVHASSAAAVVGYAAEDVMHALAELMDNATRFSAPTEEVHVYVEELHTGMVVTIEDGGLGMKPQALARAEAAVSIDDPLDLAKVPGTRLGLVVVGSLARKHKLQVYFRPSSRGGTGVVVRIPNQLIVQPREEATTQKPKATDAIVAVGGETTAPAAATATAVLDPEPDIETTAENPAGDTDEVPALPKRPRGQTLAAVTRATGTPPKPQKPNGKRADIGARFSAFQQGSRPADRPDEPGQTTAGEEGSR
jgi:signal transduction histidine kinase